MPSVPHILKMRQRRWMIASRNPIGKLGLGIAILFTLSLITLLIALPIGYVSTTQDLPSTETIPSLLEPPYGLLLHPTQIYDRTGKHVLQTVQNPVIEERRYLPISEKTDPQADEFISNDLVRATISIVDPNFWEGPGFVLNITEAQQSPSIAQKLVRAFLLTGEGPGLQYWIRERILAWQIVNQFGHEKVLEWYLNSQYYGNLAYGADSASQVYFGKPASALTLAEAALLTSVGEAPTLNPIDAPEEALKRQKIVLDAMLGQGYVTSAEASKAVEETIEFRIPFPANVNPNKDFVNLVWDQLAPFYDLEKIERGGYKIITSLDFDLQNQVICTRDTLLKRLVSPDSVYLDSEYCPAARLLPTLSVESDQLTDDLSAMLVVLDPFTGQILALAGDPNKGFNPAHLPGRPPGSMLTPFIYLTAFTRGFSPSSLVWDVPLETIDFLIPEPESYQGPIRLRNALANDYLNPAIQTMLQIGEDNVWLTMQKLGLTSFARFAENTTPSTCRGCSLLFDDGEVSLLELTNAYGTFANQGLMVGQALQAGDATNLPELQPISVLQISDVLGNDLMSEPNIERRPVITQQLAYLLTHALSDEAARWPSLGHPNPLEIGRPAAVKVGSTVDLQDTWTIGYTPERLIGVWVGSENPSQIQNGQTSSKVSASLWHAVTQYAVQSFNATSWEIPPGISYIEVCDPSGQLPTRNCPSVVSEIFLDGNEPTQFDSLYQAFQVNRETGLLATVFTPPELIQEQVFMIVPPLANRWAQEANIPIPPESYDVIAMPPVIADAHISKPEMFNNVTGKIDIVGTASGEDFISYRLQIGQGLNPSAWIQISEDQITPVVDGILANWDTSEFDGLYAVQMIVLRDNRRVDSSTIQITVDNQSPTVSIPYPENNQIFDYEFQKYITLQADVSDNIGLDSVTFYIDEQEIIRQSQQPFAVPWQLDVGEHILRVEATDFAGNVSEDSINFFVIE
jgi:membrane carboxypeptidase/penicillin-binding protein